MVPRLLQLRRRADQPTWDGPSSTLTGNAGALDTDGAAGWFEPDVRLTSLTLAFTRRAGFPVYQTWFVSRARPIGGTLTDVSAAGACAPAGAALTLLSPSGDELARTTAAADGSYSFGELATQAGYVVRLDVPDGCAVVGPAERVVSNRGNDGDPASRADFDVRAVVPQPVSGTVRDADGAPVAGVVVTLTGPGGAATTTTGEDGTYLFDDNATGPGYTVEIQVPPGYTAGLGGVQIGGIVVATTPVTGQDFTLVDLPAVSGTVTGGGRGSAGSRSSSPLSAADRSAPTSRRATGPTRSTASRPATTRWRSSRPSAGPPPAPAPCPFLPAGWPGRTSRCRAPGRSAAP